MITLHKDEQCILVKVLQKQVLPSYTSYNIKIYKTILLKNV